MIKRNTLETQKKKILEIAQQYGVEQSYFFMTTFDRYLIQLKILKELEKRIEEDGTLVTKEYVKGRENIYTHPAISEYNRTTDSANKTMTTLIKIITALGDKQGEDSNSDALLKAMRGEYIDTGE